MVGGPLTVPSPSQASSATRLERRSPQRPSSRRGETAPAAMLGEGTLPLTAGERLHHLLRQQRRYLRRRREERRKIPFLGEEVRRAATTLLPGFNAAASLPAPKMAARRKRGGGALA